MNIAFVQGTMTKDPVMKETKAGHKLSIFTVVPPLGVRGIRDPEAKPYFVQCQAWDDVAEIVNEHCYKGKKVMMYGHIKYSMLRPRHWENMFVVDYISFSGNIPRKGQSFKNQAELPTDEEDAETAKEFTSAGEFIPDIDIDEFPF